MADVLNFVRNELLEFTGLPEDVLDRYLNRSVYPNHKKEWKFWNPDCDENIRWFYIASRSYLFINAMHGLNPLISNGFKKGDVVIDFGGGSGNHSFELAQKGCTVQYFDVNILQRSFVSYVATKHRLPITILNCDSEFFPVFSTKADYILALDVLEHIPKYPKYIERLFKALKPQGKMYFFAPFNNNGKGEPAHLADKHNLQKVLKEFGFKISSVHGTPCSVASLAK